MPMYQNYNFTVKAPLDGTVNAVNKLMNKMMWRIEHEFDKFDMSVDYVHGQKRIFAKSLGVTVRFQETGEKTNVYILSGEAVGDAIVAATTQQNPDKKKVLSETHNGLLEGLRGQGML